jgi:hypothetical protein
MTTPPSYALMARASASIDSMSKWLVGSSEVVAGGADQKGHSAIVCVITEKEGHVPSNRICGCSMASCANTTLTTRKKRSHQLRSEMTKMKACTGSADRLIGA